METRLELYTGADPGIFVRGSNFPKILTSKTKWKGGGVEKTDVFDSYSPFFCRSMV